MIKYKISFYFSIVSTLMLSSCKTRESINTQVNSTTSQSNFYLNFENPDALDSNNIEKILKDLNKVNDLYLDGFNKPLIEKMIIKKKTGELGFSDIENIITISDTFMLSGVVTQDKWYDFPFELTNALNLHEFGHAIFFKSIESLSSQNIGKLSDVAKIISEENNTRKKIVELKKILEDEPQGVDLDTVDRELIKASIANQAAHNAASDINAGVLVYYNEFFSDVVSVLALNDLDAIEKGLTINDSAEGKQERAILRSFDSNKITAITSKPGWLKHGVHVYFSPTRAFFGKNYLTNIAGLSEDEKKRMIKSVFLGAFFSAEYLSKDGLEKFEEQIVDNNYYNHHLQSSIKCAIENQNKSEIDIFHVCYKDYAEN